MAAKEGGILSRERPAHRLIRDRALQPRTLFRSAAIADDFHDHASTTYFALYALRYVPPEKSDGASARLPETSGRRHGAKRPLPLRGGKSIGEARRQALTDSSGEIPRFGLHSPIPLVSSAVPEPGTRCVAVGNASLPLSDVYVQLKRFVMMDLRPPSGSLRPDTRGASRLSPFVRSV